MDTSPRTHTSIRVPIAWKFFALLALIIPSLLAVSWVGGRGMVGMKERLDTVYNDNLMSTQAIGSLSVALEEAEEMSLRLVNEVDRATIVGLDSELRQEVFPEVARRLNDVRVLSGPDSSEDGVVARASRPAGASSSPSPTRGRSSPPPGGRATTIARSPRPWSG